MPNVINVTTSMPTSNEQIPPSMTNSTLGAEPSFEENHNNRTSSNVRYPWSMSNWRQQNIGFEFFQAQPSIRPLEQNLITSQTINNQSHIDQSNAYSYELDQMQTLGRPTNNEIFLIGMLNDASVTLRQQMDHNKHDKINLLSQQMTMILNYLVQTTNGSFQILTNQIGDSLAIPRMTTQSKTLVQHVVPPINQRNNIDSNQQVQPLVVN